MGRKRSRLWIGFALVAAVCAVLAAEVLLSRIATRIVNRRLPEWVGADASVGQISLGLLRGSIFVRNLKIGNPAGFSEGEALSISRMGVNLDLLSFRGKPWVVEEIRIEGAQVRLQRNRARRMNLEVLVAHALSGQGKKKEAHAAQEAGDQLPEASNGPANARVPGKDLGSTQSRPKEKSGPIELYVESLSISDLWFVYTDATLKLEKELRDVDLRAEGLTYAPARAGEPRLPAWVALTGRVGQEPFPGAWLGLYARMGVIAKGVPPLNASFQLMDLELAPLGSVVPASAAKVLGGDALDLCAEGSVAQDLLRVVVRLETCAGNTFSVRIGGTPSRPVYDTKDLVIKILQNAATNFLGGLSDPRAIVDTAAKTGSTLGRGVAGMLETAASGLLKTTRGIAKGDLETAARGVETATAGAIGQGAEAVGGAAKGIVEEGSRPGGSSTSSERQWREKAQERWEAAWRQARERVDRMPYPGT